MHWPIIIIATEFAVQPLSTRSNVLLVLSSIIVAAISYYVIENPIRRSQVLKRSTLATFMLGAAMIGASYLAIYLEIRLG